MSFAPLNSASRPVPSAAPAAADLKAQRTIGTLVYTASGLAVLFAWLLWGDFVALLKDRSVGTVVQLLLKRFEGSDTLNGFLIGSVPAIVSLVVVPIVSYRSDRHRGRFGRRIPYLLFFTPLASVAMIGLAYSPALGQALHGWLGARSPGENTLILGSLSVFWIIFEFANIVLANALFAALINDVVPKAYLGRFYGLFRAVSLMAGIIFNYWLLGRAEQYYVWFFVGFGVLYFAGFTLMCLKVKEGEYQPPPPLKPGVAGGFFQAAGSYFKESFTKPYYLWIFAAYMFSQLAFLPVNLYNVFFAKSVQMDMDAYGKIWAYTYAISFVLAFPMGWLADRFHPIRVSIGVLLLYAGVTLWGGTFATDARSFTYVVIAFGVLSGAWYTGAASFTQRLFPQAKFAQYFSAMGIAGGVLNILVPMALGRFLDLTHHVYRYTYLIAGVLALFAVALTVQVWRRFTALGGPANYVAPE